MLSEAVFHMKFIFLTQSKVWQCCQTLLPTYRTQHRQAAMRSADAGVTKLGLLFMNSQKVADGVFLSESGFMNSQNPVWLRSPSLGLTAWMGAGYLQAGRWSHRASCGPTRGYFWPASK